MPGWNRKLYLGEGIDDPLEIRKKVNKGSFLPGIFLITLSDHPDHVLEIHPSIMMMQKRIRRTCPKIVGLAKSKKDAMKLVAEIVQEVYDNTGTLEIEKYLKKR